MLDLNRKMARGALWMGLMRLSVRTLSIISILILARLLVPADFGLVAMATSIVAFLELATAFSFDIPLIQNQQATRKHFDSAWTLNLVFFAGLTVVLVLLAIPAAAFYQDPRLTDVIYVLAGAFFIRGFENIGVVHFRKELNFGQDFVLMFSKKFIGFIVAIPLAFYFRNYWALIFGIIAGNLGGVVLSYLLHPFRPRLSLAAAGEMLNFSKWLILNNAISFLRTRSPDFVIGRLTGSTALGMFTVAYEISTLPTTELVAPINRAVFPGYSRISNDLKLLRQSYLDVVGVIALFALPAALGISAISAPLVDFALGSKWSEAAPIVALLAVYGGLSALNANNGSVYNAIGKPYLITILGSIHTAILLTASILLAFRFGALGVAAAYVGTSIAFAPVSFHVAGRQLGISFADYVRILGRPVSCSLLMFVALRFLGEQVDGASGFGSFKALLIMVPTGMVVYAGVMFLFWLSAGRQPTIEARLAGLALVRLRSGFNALRQSRAQ